MAKWLARSRGLLVKRLEVTQVPEEGQSIHQPVWSKVNLATVLDMVEHLNDKTETSRVLLAEINKLKVDNERLREMAYGRPPGEFARGGYIPRQPIRVAPAPRADEDRKTLASCKERFNGHPPIRQEPGIRMVINAPDASNSELGENVRRALASVSSNGCTTREQAARLAEHLRDDISEWAVPAALVTGDDHLKKFQDLHLGTPYTCDTPTNTDSSSPTPSE